MSPAWRADQAVYSSSRSAPVLTEACIQERGASGTLGTGSLHGSIRGDCFAYALAKELNEPLLFKGDDFGHTDIPIVGRTGERRRLTELAAYAAPAP
jgi:ribonuclease VapC